jgi:hypothetical protein
MSDTFCVVELADSTSLRCPAYPDSCDWIGRAYATGETYKRFTAAEIGENPRVILHQLLAESGANVEPWIDEDTGRMVGDEIVFELDRGGAIRCPSEPIDGFYVRITDIDGTETAYWDEQEFSDDPEVVLGAFLGAALGAVVIDRD